MDKFIKIVIIVIVFMISLFVISFDLAQSSSDLDSVSFATYYPAPYGVYNEMRLYPHNPATTACDSTQEGLLYYDSSEHLLKVCTTQDGIVYFFSPVPGIKSSGSKTFNSSATFNLSDVSSDVTMFYVTTIGAGGGGGGGGCFGSGGGGGAGEVKNELAFVNRSSVHQINVTVGIGGQGGIKSNNLSAAGPGIVGENSMFGSYVLAHSGRGGVGGFVSGGGIGGPAGGAGGANGNDGFQYGTGSYPNGGTGGVTTFGSGVGQGGNGGQGGTLTGFFNCSDSTNGTAGTDGLVIVQW